MEIKQRRIELDATKKNNRDKEIKRVGNYECELTRYNNIFKIIGGRERYVVRCYYGKIEKINKKTGLKREVNEVTLKVVDTITEARMLMAEVERIRNERKNGIILPQRIVSDKITLDDIIDAYKKDVMYTDLTDNYKMHYDNYFRHISDFMGYKEPKKITVADIEQYYDYQLNRGNLSNAKKTKNGDVSKKETSIMNPNGISVNTLSKHKTALKSLWKFMLKKGCYGIEQNIPKYTDIPKVEIEIDGKKIKTRKIQPKQKPLTLEQLNYTLNDAIQNEHDRSVVLLIALGAIGGLRRSEVVALKIGRYYHDERMKLGEEMWALNDFRSLRQYYESHNELIMIDEAITHNRVDVLGFPKDNIIRMVGKPHCLEKIVEYTMEQRKQICEALGCDISSCDRLYMPLINVIQQNVYSSQKVSRKWTEYQKRRNDRMEKAGIEPIPIVRFHDLRHTHASLLSDEVADKKIAKNMGHVFRSAESINNTTTRVYIHDMKPDRSDIIKYWDEHICIDWDKALRVNINEVGNRAHVNGSGHLVIKDEEKQKVLQLRKRFVLTEEEEARLLCSK